MLRVSHLLPVLAASLAVPFLGCVGDPPTDIDTTPGATTFDVSGVQMAVPAGVDGTIWVLASYGNGVAHPGLNSIDIGAPGGTSVWHQIDALPAEIAGGFLYVDFVQEAGYCSQYVPGDTYYNGAKLRVFTYFYGVDGKYLGHQAEVYQHVVPAEGVNDKWFTWNNPGAGTMWPAPDMILGNRDAGGLYLGALFDGGGKLILNGPNGKLCHLGNHLHQEGSGSRAALGIDDVVSGRFDSAHVFYVDPAVPYAGNPPAAPPAVGDAPPPDPVDPPDPPDPVDPPPPPPPGSCACKTGVDNFCHYAAKTVDCAMTFPGGYCDPNGDGDYADADWVKGYYDFNDTCGSAPPPPPPPPPPSPCECKSGVDNFCHYAPNTTGCDMTKAGGYCDPNGDGSYADADWTTGWYDFNAKCGG